MTQTALATDMPRHDVAVAREPGPAPVVDAFLAMIERAARDPAVDIDKMERLMLMRERQFAQAAEQAFNVAMSEMQPNLPVVEQNGLITIHAKDDTNKTRAPIQSTKFAKWEDINEAIVPVLAKHGFSLTFSACKDGDRVVVTGFVRHVAGHKEKTELSLALDTSGSKNNVQAVGSSISYGKRYCAGLLLNITSRDKGHADDDGVGTGEPDKVSADQVAQLRKALDFVDGDEIKFCRIIKIESLDSLPASQFSTALARINAKGRQS